MHAEIISDGGLWLGSSQRFPDNCTLVNMKREFFKFAATQILILRCKIGRKFSGRFSRGHVFAARCAEVEIEGRVRYRTRFVHATALNFNLRCSAACFSFAS